MDSVAALRLVELDVFPVTTENFRPYGTLIEVAEDGDAFGPNEAQLDLSRGTPRFYEAPPSGRSPGICTSPSASLPWAVTPGF
jgi:hypothetical protein